MISSCCFKFRG